MPCPDESPIIEKEDTTLILPSVPKRDVPEWVKNIPFAPERSFPAQIDGPFPER